MSTETEDATGRDAEVGIAVDSVELIDIFVVASSVVSLAVVS